jgi:F-type H+-transporting ATPase subunit c
MDNITVIGMTSIITAGAAITIGVIAPAIGEALSIVKALEAIAQQPDEADTLSRNLFVGLAMIESLAIYCLVISIILIFTNPFWTYIIAHGGK